MQIINANADTDKRLLAIISRLVSETGRRHVKDYAIALVLSALVAATAGGIAFLIRDVVNEIFVAQNRSALFLISGLVALAFVVRGFAMFGQAVVLGRISNAIVLELQVRLFRKALSKEPSYLTGSSSGELMTVIGVGAAASRDLLKTLAMAIMRDLLTLIALVSVLFYQDAVLAFGVALVLPAIAIIVASVTSRLRRIARQKLQVGAEMGNKIRSGIQGLPVVKAFSLEREFGDEMEAFAAQQEKLANKGVVVSNRIAPMMELAAGLAISGAILAGGWRIIDDGQTPGELVSFIFAALMMYDPARRLGQARATIEKSLVGVRTMYDFIDSEDGEADRAGVEGLRGATGRVVFDGVSFAYRDDEPVLRDVSFQATPGTTTAIVGRSGGGKSTIANLLLRFWEADQGDIQIDGQSIVNVSKRSLRDTVAFVGQNAFLFDGSLRANILAGNRDATEEELQAAIRDAGAADFIAKLPNGLETNAGELGSNLSGGQRQRIAIARALIRNSPILLLDEPTAALDNVVEREVQQSLKRLSAGRTVIIIAHRLTTIRDADQILVVDHGRIVESGKHVDLIEAGGRYAELYREAPSAAPEKSEAAEDA